MQFIIAVKNLLVITALFLSIAACSLAENALPPGKSISVKFVVDGQPVTCKKLTIDLSIGGKHLEPTRTPDGFVVPPIFIRA